MDEDRQRQCDIDLPLDRQHASSTSPQCRALILAEIADFAGLRKALGIESTDRVADDVAGRIVAELPDIAVRSVGRTLIEIRARIASRSALDALVASIHRCVEAPIMIGNRSSRVRLRIGAAMAALDGDTLALVETAEAALAKAQLSANPDNADGYTMAIDTDDAAIGQRIERAIAHDDLFLQYQPKLHLRQQKITGVEALVRWRDPVLGLILPGDFIPAAERSGAIKALTMWTLRQAVNDQQILSSAGYDLPVFVNIAGVLLSDADFVDAAAELARDSGAKLGFEITETSVIRDPETAIAHLHRLADIGVAITIDDYGAGLSSLAYLKQLPAREIKIDKMFVTHLASSHRDPLIVRSTIDLAHALEMEVVAEGVETQISLALLSVMGCDMVQGYLVSRPLVLENLLTFLREEAFLTTFAQSGSPLQRMSAVRARA